jgi:hypothetical protein
MLMLSRKKPVGVQAAEACAIGKHAVSAAAANGKRASIPKIVMNPSPSFIYFALSSMKRRRRDCDASAAAGASASQTGTRRFF